MSFNTGTLLNPFQQQSRGCVAGYSRAVAAPKSFSRLPVDERRAQLLAVGRRMFNERRYSEVSVEEIARRVGISPGLLYHYFPNKQEFFTACVAAELDEFVTRLRAVEGDLPYQRFLASLDVYLDFALSERGGFLNVMQDTSGSSAVAKLLERTRHAVRDEILAGLELDSSPALRVALAGYMGFVEGATLDWLRHGDLPRDTFKSLLVSGVYHALMDAAALDPAIDLPQAITRPTGRKRRRT